MNKKILLSLALAGLSMQVASANVILETFTDLGGTGLGTVATILTYQNNGSESGCVGLNSSIGASYTATGACTGTGDTKTGNSQTQLQALSAVGIVGGNTLAVETTAASQFGLVFNASQISSGPLTVDNITVAIYDPTGTTLLYKSTGFECLTTQGGTPTAGPCTVPSTGSGVGNSGYLVTLDAAQQADAIAAGAFNNSGNLVGVSSSAGTGTAAANDGVETIFLTRVGSAGPSSVPEPGTWPLFLSAAGFLGFSRLRRTRTR